MISRRLKTLLIATTAVAAALGGGSAFAGVLGIEQDKPEDLDIDIIDDGYWSDESLFDYILQDTTATGANKALDILEEQLFVAGDIGSILGLASRIEAAGGPSPRLKLLESIAYAATGDTEKARAARKAALDVALSAPSTLDHLSAALIARNEGDLTRAKLTLEGVTAANENNAFALNVLGGVLMAQGDLVGATAYYRRAAEAGDETPVFETNLGAALLAQENFTEAALHLNNALAADKEYCPALVNLGAVAFRTGRYGEGAGFAELCLDSPKRDERSAQTAANLLVRSLTTMSAYSEAIEAVEENATLLGNADALKTDLLLRRGDGARALAALEGKPATPASMMQKAFAYALIGNKQAANNAAAEAASSATGAGNSALTALATGFRVADGGAVTTIDKGSPTEVALTRIFTLLDDDAANNAAALRNAQADFRLAGSGVNIDGMEKILPAALAASPNRKEIALGLVYFARGFWEPAASTFASIDADGPVGAFTTYLQGLAQMNAGAREKSAEALRSASAKAEAAGAGFFNAEAMLGDLAAGAGNRRAALDHYRKAIAIQNDAAISLKLGVVADMLDEVAIAEAAYRDVIRLSPESFLGYNQLAWLFVQRETRLDEALAAAQQAYKLAPENKSVLDTLGQTYALSGDYDKALPLLAKAQIAADGADADVALNLAGALVATGDRAAAESVIRQAREKTKFTAAHDARAAEILKK